MAAAQAEQCCGCFEKLILLYSFAESLLLILSYPPRSSPFKGKISQTMERFK